MNPRLTALLALLPLSGAQALTIVLDYSHDISTDNFFGTNATAKAALEQARNDLQTAITTTLAAVGSDTAQGTNGGTTATYDFNLSYTNPSTGVGETIAISTLGADQMTIFVGVRELTGATLGQGGPGSTGLSIGGSGFPAEWPGAVTAANAAASAQRMRGGPLMGTLSGSVDLGGSPGLVDVDFSPSTGNLWFDVDTDNNGLTDSAAQLDAAWHFDWNAPVAPGKSDFYTVALHELLHALGVGTAQSWDNLISGSDWLGAEAIALQGSGSGLVTTGHIASGINSPRLSDGLMQETVMSPTLTVGTRKTLTQLDLAILRDIGWQTVPEPGVGLLSLLSAGLLLRRRRG